MDLEALDARLDLMTSRFSIGTQMGVPNNQGPARQTLNSGALSTRTSVKMKANSHLEVYEVPSTVPIRAVGTLYHHT